VRLLAPAEQEREQRLALVASELRDPAGELPVHEQARPPGLGMDPHHRVLGLALRMPVVGRAVDRREAGQHLAHRRREALEGEILVRPHGVTTGRRDLVRLEHRTHRWRRIEGDVGVPHVGDETAVGVQHDDLGVLVRELRDERVDLGFPEAGRERHVLVGREVLTGEEQHEVLEQERLQSGKAVVVEPPDIEPVHLGTERAADRAHLEACLRLRVPGDRHRALPP
jgi:hypothetical protein